MCLARRLCRWRPRRAPSAVQVTLWGAPRRHQQLRPPRARNPWVAALSRHRSLGAAAAASAAAAGHAGRGREYAQVGSRSRSRSRSRSPRLGGEETLLGDDSSTRGDARLPSRRRAGYPPPAAVSFARHSYAWVPQCEPRAKNVSCRNNAAVMDAALVPSHARGVAYIRVPFLFNCTDTLRTNQGNL